jgi:GNAT superfamily N-acetyltransferase
MSRGVWPNQHGRGLGRWLRQFAVEWVSAQGGEAISIWVHISNEEHYEKVRKDPFWEPTGMAFDPKAVMFTHYIGVPYDGDGN